MIRSYTQVLDSDRASVGGKGWAIAKLAQAGILVPKGFCITNKLTLLLLDSDDSLKKNYSNYLFGVDNSGRADETLSRLVKNGIDKVNLPLNATKELSGALDNAIPIDSLKIIVRSSASVEDSKKASFAGQFKTTVTEKNYESLTKTIKECWKAIVSPSLAAYAFALQTRLSDIFLGFIVQEFLDFDYSGVLFTKSPIKAGIGDFVVEYAEGGAEKIVSGRITPNSCLIKGGNKSVEWLRRSENTSHPSEKVLLRLGVLAAQSKNLFKLDQDIEWGIIGSRVFLVQSRPVTS